jgi:mannobiose 2-epimerase
MTESKSIKQDRLVEALPGLQTELNQELERLLSYWLTNMIDESNGGFYGKRLSDESLVADAPKGAVLNARILWSFAAAYRHTAKAAYFEAAHRAYDYFIHHFIDEEFGGVYWSVTSEGAPLGTKKQVYALSFAIYALAEYYCIVKDEQAKSLAIDLFNVIEKYSRDRELGGYIEAFTREWLPADDLRLSDKDANEKKTMNTHLHILEAYTNLYRIHPDATLQEAIINLLVVFDRYIIDAKTHHLVLFFDEAWNPKGTQVSYGHDIEAAWLLSEAAEVIDDKKWMRKMNAHAISIAKAAAEGIDSDNGMWHEYDPVNNHLVKEKHWWPQAEAMVGFLHAWQVSGDVYFLELVFDSWRFIKEYILDQQDGEWFWGVNEYYSIMDTEDKAGFWKCPYHNSRACMEVVERIGRTGHSS